MNVHFKLLILLQLSTTVLLEKNETVSSDIPLINSHPNAVSEVVPKSNFSNLIKDIGNISSSNFLENKESNENKTDIPILRSKRQLVGVHVPHPRQRKINRGNGVHRSSGYEIKEVHNPHIVGYGSEILYHQKEGGHEIHDPHGGGGYGHESSSDGGYGHESSSGGGYGHDIHGGDGGGYGQIDHGYKEPPKHIKAAPYYGPQYSPYDLIAPDKSKKNKKTKYGDDPIYEKGHYKDEPTAHFGGFGGGGSIGYNTKGKGGGYKGSGGGHKGGGGGGGYKAFGGHKGGGGGYKGSSGGHKGGGGGYKGSGGHKGGGGGYKGSEEHKGGGGGYKGSEEHKGGGGGYGKSQSGYSAHSVQINHELPSYEHVSIPFNTYDAHADVRNLQATNTQEINKGHDIQHVVETGLNLNLRGANADVSDMLLYDPYALTVPQVEKVAGIQLPGKVLNLRNV